MFVLFFSGCDTSQVTSLINEENVQERTDTGLTLLHIACLSGGIQHKYSL